MAGMSSDDVQMHLSGVNYPATKQDLLNEAEEQGVGEEIRSALAQLPDQEYETPDAVSDALRANAQA